MDLNRNWQEFALILIDVQQDFWNEELESYFPNFKHNITDLLQFCRREGLEVIHLREIFSPDGSDWLVRYRLRGRAVCVRGTPGAEVLSVAKETGSEMLFEKQTLDGFHNPKLLEYLRSNNKRYLLTAGLTTAVCVLFTSVSAAQQGFLVAVIEDCCADYLEAHQMALKRYKGFLLNYIQWQQITDRYCEMVAAIDRLKTD